MSRLLLLLIFMSASVAAQECSVNTIDYELATLVAPKVPPKFHQVRRVTFRFVDGSAQTCAATTVSKP